MSELFIFPSLVLHCEKKTVEIDFFKNSRLIFVGKRTFLHIFFAFSTLFQANKMSPKFFHYDLMHFISQKEGWWHRLFVFHFHNFIYPVSVGKTSCLKMELLPGKEKYKKKISSKNSKHLV